MAQKKVSELVVKVVTDSKKATQDMKRTLNDINRMKDRQARLDQKRQAKEVKATQKANADKIKSSQDYHAQNRKLLRDAEYYGAKVTKKEVANQRWKAATVKAANDRLREQIDLAKHQTRMTNKQEKANRKLAESEKKLAQARSSQQAQKAARVKATAEGQVNPNKRRVLSPSEQRARASQRARVRDARLSHNYAGIAAANVASRSSRLTGSRAVRNEAIRSAMANQRMAINEATTREAPKADRTAELRRKQAEHNRRKQTQGVNDDLKERLKAHRAKKKADEQARKADERARNAQMKADEKARKDAERARERARKSQERANRDAERARKAQARDSARVRKEQERARNAQRAQAKFRAAQRNRDIFNTAGGLVGGRGGRMLAASRFLTGGAAMAALPIAAIGAGAYGMYAGFDYMQQRAREEFNPYGSAINALRAQQYVRNGVNDRSRNAANQRLESLWRRSNEFGSDATNATMAFSRLDSVLGNSVSGRILEDVVVNMGALATLTGSSAEAEGRSMLGLTQLASGAVDAENLKQMYENNPALKPLIAQGFGISMKELQRRQSAGTLKDIFDQEKFITRFAQALSEQNEKLFKEFRFTSPVAEKFLTTSVSNAWKQIGGGMAGGQGYGLVGFLDSITSLLTNSNNVQMFKDVGQVMESVFTGLMTGVKIFAESDALKGLQDLMSELANNPQKVELLGKTISEVLSKITQGIVSLITGIFSALGIDVGSTTSGDINAQRASAKKTLAMKNDDVRFWNNVDAVRDGVAKFNSWFGVEGAGWGLDAITDFGMGKASIEQTLAKGMYEAVSVGSTDQSTTMKVENMTVQAENTQQILEESANQARQLNPLY